MKITVDVIGEKELDRALKKMSEEKSRKIKGEIFSAGHDVRTEAMERLSGKRGGTRAWKTGHLARSIIVDLMEDDKIAEVGPEAPYGPYVEFGTRKMPARPFLFPAFLMIRDKFWKRIKEILEK